MRAIAVIGACWGDEGKGAAVDALAAKAEGPLVIRHNGGAQAGHTVVTPKGTRHIFSHFCAGALAGAPGYLSEHFVINPRIFYNELAELEHKGANLKLTVHPNALVTTPADVAINRALEMKLGKKRHGSVGIGFGETIERSGRGFPIFAKDLSDTSLLKQKMRHIMLYWNQLRLSELAAKYGGSVRIPSEIDDYHNPDLIDSYCDQCNKVADHVNFTPLELLVKDHETIIFEGAQGLLLDQKRGFMFPHVTRSNTGLQNVMPILEQLKIEELTAIYMMRPYMTRHGAGPMPGEGKKVPFIIEDNTNKTGPWQGELRLAPMNRTLVQAAIDTDLSEAKGFNIKPHIGVSCIDQARTCRTIHNTFCEFDYTIAIQGNGPKRGDYHMMSKLQNKRIQLVGS